MHKLGASVATFLVALAIAGNAAGHLHLFYVDQVYSNASGTIQFVVFKQFPPANDEHLWGGSTLTSTHDGTSQAFVYPHDLPSNVTATKRVLLATQGFADLNLVPPDFIVPNGFLGTGATTLVSCGECPSFAYASLPTDGVMAIDGFKTPVANLATNFAGKSGSVTAEQANAGGPAAVATVVEFYNAVLDHYFITWIAAEIANLDAGKTPTKWDRTGAVFKTNTSAATGTDPVCRYYIPPEKGSSHFFGRGTVECNQTGQKNPTFVLEDPAFMHMTLPAAGICPPGTVPVYRVFSDRPDANHRYVIDRALRDQMVAKGWLAEGDGADLVVMCSPA